MPVRGKVGNRRPPDYAGSRNQELPVAEWPDWTEKAKREEDAARQTRSLAAFAVLLLVLVAALGLTHTLRRSAAVEDCMLAGRINCDRLVQTGR